MSFAWADGTVVFDGVNATFPRGLTGVVGDNGSGKSTLLRLLVGAFEPRSGSVVARGRVGYLPQDLAFDADSTIADAMGIAEVVTALRSIEAGTVDPAAFEVVGDRWSVEDRATAVLYRLGLRGAGLDRKLATLSGGECIFVGLAGLLLAQPDVLVLDEPTNNLDRDHRRLLLEAVTGHTGCVVVVSHDRSLLSTVDHIAEVTNGDVRMTTGDIEHFEVLKDRERAVAERRVRDALAEERRQRREYDEALIRLDRRARFGAAMSAQKRRPKVVANELKRRSQVSGARLRNQQRAALDGAQQTLDEARSEAQRADHIRLELPATEVPATRRVVELERAELRNGATVTMHIRGPERIAVVGSNGSGKTTLLRTIAGELEPTGGRCAVHVPVGYLPQRMENLDLSSTVIDSVRRRAPGQSDNDLRAGLARLLFRGSEADRTIATLSGGERFRAALASILLADPAPQLLMLDEPTNNLDFASVDQLVAALDAYRGALVLVTHDELLLDRLEIQEVSWGVRRSMRDASPTEPAGTPMRT